MAILLDWRQFVKEYIDRGLLTEGLYIRHVITGEILPDVPIIDYTILPADHVPVFTEDRFYDPFVVKEMLGPMRDVLWEEAKKRRVFTRIAPLCRATHLGVDIVCERVPYHYVWLIHSNADYVLRERGLYEPTRLRDALRYLMARNGRLVPLNKSHLPNVLSVHILLISKDGYVILPRRSSRMSIAANTLSVFEGYVETDWDKLEQTAEDLAYIELEDEAGLKKGDAQVYYIGAYRSVWTLGRPMAHFMAFSDIEGKELLKRVEAVGSREHASIEIIKLSDVGKDPDTFLDHIDYQALEALAKREDDSPTMKLITHILGLLLSRTKLKIDKGGREILWSLGLRKVLVLIS